jgi:hypothetical protein
VTIPRVKHVGGSLTTAVEVANAHAPRSSRMLIVSLLVAAGAFAMYRATLLPSLDFGDTAAFQDAGGTLEITPRQGYPLYFAIGNVIVWLAGREPAFGMNLASAVCAALACGVLTWVAADLTASLTAGIFTGVLFAASYTFWSQAIIAEVYALHVLMVAASLAALAWWAKRPESLPRLATFFAAYALGFGNHLMMVLLLPAATIFLTITIPGGLRGLLRGRVVGLAVGIAALGALQYAWNFRSMYSASIPPAGLAEALQAFWFDVTKSDWRSTMVMGVDESALRPRLGMYWFDVTQQFGTFGVAVALVGLAALVRRWRVGLLVLTGWLVSALFAYTYNVGDAHVFFIPSHVFVALAAGEGIALLLRAAEGRRAAVALVTFLALAFPAWRVFDTWPAVDRSGDTRPSDLVRDLAGDLPSERTVLLADLNWQLQNGLDYYARHTNPDLLHMRAAGRLLTLPWLIDDNLRHGRDIVLTRGSAQLVRAAFGDTWTIKPERRHATLPAQLEQVPQGTPYVLTLLRAYRDVPLDTDELSRMVAVLTRGTATLPTGGVYTVMVGRSGERPLLVRSEPHPFRIGIALSGMNVEVRMESWLPPDTIRRAGFGHVIVNRRHALTLERGVGVIAFGENGRTRLAGYASGLFAPEPRFRIRAAPGA